jgi:hypothetical protein
VLLADGSTKPIAAIQVGDVVLATNPETGETSAETVTAAWVHDDILVALLVGSAALSTTEDHLFWNATDQQWQEAHAFDPGDTLLTPMGEAVTVAGLSWATTRLAPAYNLTVDDLHTYYVVAGTTPVLVHNADPGCGARFVVDSNGEITDVRPPSRGSTGGQRPVMQMSSRPWTSLCRTPSTETACPSKMNDPRWSAEDGWVKMEQTVNGVEIHYVYNTRTGIADDFKFKDWS